MILDDPELFCPNVSLLVAFYSVYRFGRSSVSLAYHIMEIKGLLVGMGRVQIGYSSVIRTFLLHIAGYCVSNMMLQCTHRHTFTAHKYSFR